MNNKVRFLADEHVDMPAVKKLQSKGINIISAEEAGLRRMPDIKILEFANKERRVVVTRDRDFLRLASQGEKHKGIIFLTRSLAAGDIIREMEKISILYKPQDIENSIVYIPLK